MNIRPLILICALFCFAFSCDDRADIEADECPQNIGCTKIYVLVTAEIKDANDKPYKLDAYYTTKISTGEKISYQNQETDASAQYYGAYPILGDGQLAKTSKTGQEFEFIGFKDGKEVLRKKFVIGHDCCHVHLVSGDTKITML